MSPERLWTGFSGGDENALSDSLASFYGDAGISTRDACPRTGREGLERRRGQDQIRAILLGLRHQAYVSLGIVDVKIQTDAKIGSATQKWQINTEAAIVIFQ